MSIQRRTFLGFLGGVLGLGLVEAQAKPEDPAEPSILAPKWRRTVSGNGRLIYLAAHGCESSSVLRQVRVSRPTQDVFSMAYNGYGGCAFWEPNLGDGIIYTPDWPVTVEVPVVGKFAFWVRGPDGTYAHVLDPEKSPEWVVQRL